MTIKWTGRVEKHTDTTGEKQDYGIEENIELLEDYYEPLTVIATSDDDGKTVREVLEKAFGVSSKLLAAARTTDYGLTINEERVYISAPVRTGEAVRLRQLREQSEDILPQSMPISIVYEDNELLVVNKPAGMIVHPTHGHYTNTLANGVVAYWNEKNERFRFRPIHRLDEETSGLVVIAKNAYIHHQLSEQMQQGKVDKYYMALVYGVPKPLQTMIDAPIDRDPLNPHLRVVTPDGYPSQTLYTVQQSFMWKDDEEVSLVKLKLITGRTHQIRVHMQSIGHPLIGDKLYGNRRIAELESSISRHALHAQSIRFIHPTTKQIMECHAPIPEDFQNILNKMQEGTQK
ncbi:RluA family pseudouridine synthase [Paenibacillus sp. FSL W7-1287]|uniref:RluA family pseudouridine synthase n=1 Tax=Paenibacillus sp. FSL W7-1287 TaxID=2954538 RepID=UPI0030FA4FDE